MELCNVCKKYIQKSDMQSHILGKKHLKLADIDEKNKRSIIVNIPANSSESELYTFFSQYGTIKNHRVTLTKKGIIFEFADARVTEFLTTTPLHMKGKKLKIHRKVSPSENKKCVGHEKGNVEQYDVISYNRIQHVFDENNTFDSQLLAFLNAIQVTNQELDTRYNPVYYKLNTIFTSIFPKCKTYKFGSTQLGLGFKECDLDIFLDIGNRNY